jgi:hypothetical protein
MHVAHFDEKTKWKVGSSMTQVIDPNVVRYSATVDNLKTPPDLNSLLVAKAAIDQQILNTPSSHPSFAALQARQSTLAAAIAAHPKGGGK